MEKRLFLSLDDLDINTLVENSVRIVLDCLVGVVRHVSHAQHAVVASNLRNGCLIWKVCQLASVNLKIRAYITSIVKLVCVIIVLALKSGITLPQGAKSVEVKLSNLLNDKPASSQPNGTINKQE
jgi:hypothetical protein